MIGKTTSMSELKKYCKELEKKDDFEKLQYLTELREKGVPFQIIVDNDDVQIVLLESTVDTDGIYTSFYDNGYHLLPSLFQFIGFESDFV